MEKSPKRRIFRHLATGRIYVLVDKNDGKESHKFLYYQLHNELLLFAIVLTVDKDGIEYLDPCYNKNVLKWQDVQEGEEAPADEAAESEDNT